MIVDRTIEDKYIDFHRQNESRWDFGNSVLYRMCEEHPCHENADVIVGKIWLIGRSYAAAIERRKNSDEYHGDDFYYDVVAPKLLSIGGELDRRIRSLKRNRDSIEASVPQILSTHKLLMDAFYEITQLEKRSLASKYLHFHCPSKFFIYDSRASEAIRRIIQRPDKSILPDNMDYDEGYADFVCRMIELQHYLSEKTGSLERPRSIDSFLLNQG